MAAPKEKPVVVATAFGAPGHNQGLVLMSAHLVKKGFEVYLITSADAKPAIEKAGARFVENPWKWEPVFAARPSNADNTWALKHLFGDSTPGAHRLLKETLEQIRRDQPNREVVILHESLSGSLGPFEFGAPLPEGYSSLPKVINFHTSVSLANHDSIPPFGPGLPYDPTPENLALWRTIRDASAPPMARVTEHYNNLYKSLGATRPIEGNILDVLMAFGDVTILATSPSLDYPIPAPNLNLRFIGGLPLRPLDPSFVYPSWWSTIPANAALPADSPSKKRLVFVTQGTAHREPHELLIPTITALAARTDLIVVATLGFRGAELDIPIPANTIVVDYFPYDAVLPYADVFVSNAGYGGFMHGVMNGVPMVLAGTTADKGEVCARAEWAGVAVNLRAQEPSEEAIRAGVDKVLGDERFKEKAVELQRENEGLDALGQLERVIEELVGGF